MMGYTNACGCILVLIFFLVVNIKFIGNAGGVTDVQQAIIISLLHC